LRLERIGRRLSINSINGLRLKASSLTPKLWEDTIYVSHLAGVTTFSREGTQAHYASSAGIDSAVQ
jgi:hypothetical protein